MSIIVPAVLPKSRTELDAALARFTPLTEVTHVQVDVVDGVFATPASWPYGGSETWELPLTERFLYDVDLMVHDAQTALTRFVELGANRVTLHAESSPALPSIIAEFKRKYGHEAGFMPRLLELGIAINVDTSSAILEPFINEVDYVQFMGIAHIGKQGQPFDRRVIAKIRDFHTLHPSMTIQIDGGVTLETASELLGVGADRLVVGHALIQAKDIAAELARFEALGEQFGIFEP